MISNLKIPLSGALVLIFNLFLSSQIYNVNRYETIDNVQLTSVNQIIIDKFDNLWLGTNSGLFVFNGQNIKNLNQNFINPRIVFLIDCEYSEDLIVIDGNFNYYEINTKTFRIKHLLNNKINNPFPCVSNTSNNVIYNLSKDLKSLTEYFYIDSTLIATQQNYHPNLITNFKIFSNQYYDLNQDLVNKNLLIKSKNIHFSIGANKISKLLKHNGKIIFESVIHNIELTKSLHQLKVGVFNERNKRFYLGSTVKGLYEVYPTYFNVLKPKLKSEDVLNNLTVFYSQSEDNYGKIFINNHLTIENNQKIELYNVLEYSRALNYKDKNENIWISDNNHISIFAKDIKLNFKLFFDSLTSPVISMCEVNDTCNVLAGLNQLIISRKNKTPKYIKKEVLNFKQNEDITYIFSEKNNIFLLSNQAIYKFNLLTLTSKPINDISIADYRIMSHLKDDLKFIGTYGQGYLLYDGKKWTNMPLDKKQYLKFAHAALCDSKGHVWISTNNGLFRTRLQDIVDYINGKSKDIFYYYYDKSSGFLTNEFNGGCQSPAIKLKNGLFSFSSMDGLVQFDPIKVPAIFPDNTVRILHLWLNKKLQDTLPEVLKVNQDIKEIKLEVSTAFYGHPNNLEIQYKISGYVDEWQDVTDNRYIMIQNAKHGRFNIEIRKRRGFGNDDFDYISYSVEVLPYFYQTWWFIAILSLIGLSLSYIFSRWYSRYMIQKNKELEMLILERNKEVLQTNEVLQEQVKQNDLFQSIFVHDIKSPIRFITSNTALLKTHWNHLDTTIKQDQISHIHDAATKIDHFIEETLLWIKIRIGELQLETNDFQALAMIQECIDFHKESDKIIRGDIQILADVHQDLYLTQDERLLATIIRNLISNSIKYTAHGKIIVYFLSKPNGSFTIGCKDTGKGMPKSLVEKLLSDHYRGNDIRDDSFKMGYVIIKEIVRLIGGQLHIESEENHGTHVWVEI